MQESRDGPKISPPSETASIVLYFWGGDHESVVTFSESSDRVTTKKKHKHKSGDGLENPLPLTGELSTAYRKG